MRKKRIKSWVIASLLSVVCVGLLQVKTFAASCKYSISNININAQIDASGDMIVMEQYDYAFEGSFDGIKREINTRGCDGIYDVSARVVYGDDRKAANFAVKNTDGGKEIRIYSKSVDQSKTFIISYKLKNVITSYLDLSELKWVFYENERDTATSSVTVYLTLPKEVDSSVTYNGEGSDRTLISLDKDKKIKFRLNDLDKGESIGADVLFPNSWVNTFKNMNMTRDQYYQLQKKDQLMTSAEAIAFLSIGTAAICIIIYFFVKKRKNALEQYRKQYVFYHDKYYSKLPSELPPQLVAVLINKYVGINELMAAILNLSNKGAIAFLESGFSEKDCRHLAFRIKEVNQAGLMESEVFLINWLREYSKEDLVFLRLIEEDACKANFDSLFSAWKKILKKEANSLGLYTQVMGKKILTNKYEDERIKWMAFKAYIKESDYREIVNLMEKGLWEKILPYSMVLGVAPQMLENVRYNSDYSDNGIFMNHWFLSYYTDIDNCYRAYMDKGSTSDNCSRDSSTDLRGGGGSSAF